MKAAGFDERVPTVTAWLGVVPYLTTEGFRATMRLLARFKAGSEVVFDYSQPREVLPPVEQLMHDALALERCGACCVVLEGIPREVAALITQEIEIPTIGIGAGPDCDGQVLVFHDVLGLTFAPPAKFVRRYADLSATITSAVQAFKSDVKDGSYPSDAESYHLPKDTLSTLQAIADRKRAMQV